MTQPFILATTDFSATDEHAIEFAAQMAEAQGLRLNVIHSFAIMPLLYNSGIPMPVLPVEELREAALGKMQQLEKRLFTKFPRLSVNYTISYGSAADGIEEAAKTDKAVLAIIGYETDESRWIDDNTPIAMKHLKMPVLAVPENAAWEKPTHICIACDDEMLKMSFPLETLKKITQENELKITLLHIAENAVRREKWDYEGSPLQKSLAGAFVTHFVASSANIEECIARFADTNSADWLAIMPHHHNFFHSLFHKSHTKELLHRLHIPVLALHDMQ